MKAYIKKGIIYLSLVVFGFLIAKWTLTDSEEKVVDNHSHQVEEFTCSMHPQIRLPEMGKCPICGMDLIPAAKKSKKQKVEAVSFSERALKLAQIETHVVGENKSGQSIRLSGKVQPDERLIYTQTAHFGGRLESFKVKYSGESVRLKEIIGSMYSPDLITATKELQSAYKSRDTQPQWYESARAKLKNWKLTEDEINRLLVLEGESEVLIHSDFEGIVVKINVTEGNHVERGSPLYQLADLSKVWVLLDVYESEMDVVTAGKQVRFSVPALGKEFTGKIEFVDPFIDSQTRVAKARISVSNPGLELKPEMLVSGVLETEDSKKSEVIIPKSAVLWTGKRSIVYVNIPNTEKAAFVLREVVLGTDLGDFVEVKEGLENGEEIAVNGAFTIDAAAQLEGKPSMLNQ